MCPNPLLNIITEQGIINMIEDYKEQVERQCGCCETTVKEDNNPIYNIEEQEQFKIYNSCDNLCKKCIDEYYVECKCCGNKVYIDPELNYEHQEVYQKVFNELDNEEDYDIYCLECTENGDRINYCDECCKHYYNELTTYSET